jgi:cyclic pyranopterin phosphate synthase
MPAEGISLSPSDNLMKLDEQKRAISIFAALGVSKIRFTGGEPTLNKSLADLIRHAASQKSIESIGITSNGLVLKNQLNSLLDAGLTSANISLDTLIPEKFAAITRRDKKGLYKVLSAIYDACSRKELSVKINCVLMRNKNDDELANFISLTKDNAIDCRFIEMMPFDGNSWDPSKMLGYYEVLDGLKEQVHGNLILLLQFHSHHAMRLFTCYYVIAP